MWKKKKKIVIQNTSSIVAVGTPMLSSVHEQTRGNTQ
jgi:hypothetical protein